MEYSNVWYSNFSADHKLRDILLKMIMQYTYTIWISSRKRSKHWGSFTNTTKDQHMDK